VVLPTLELCVLLWAAAGEAEALAAYEDTVLSLIPEHGGEVVSRVRRTEGDSDDAPLEVQMIYLPHEDALTSYMNDTRRLALADTHRRVIAPTELIRVTTVV
jgi:uncharacterized protein (DUF1330 family)